MKMKDIYWKLSEHRELLSAELSHSMVRDVLDKEYRKKAYEAWQKLPMKHAESLGIVFSDKTPPGVPAEIFMEGIYDVEGFVPKKDDIVIDIGAYYGDSAIWWSKLFEANVIAFEPLTDVFGELQENIELNGLQSRIKAFNVALGSGERIYGNRSGAMFSVIADQKIGIETRTLDSFDLESDMVKIDVEGFEYEVLKGAYNTLEKYKPKVIIETHSKELKAKCSEYLTDIGYTLKVEGRKIKVNDVKGMNIVQNLFYEAVE